MSEEVRKPVGSPSFYWDKPLQARPRVPSTGFVNKQQKRFYIVATAFKLAKIAAVAAIALLIIGRI